MRTLFALPTLALSGLLMLAAPKAAMAQSIPGSSASSFSGELGANGAMDPTGRSTDTRTINLVAGEEVELTASSDAFDTVLRVQGPGGFSQENDDADGQGGTDSRVQFRAPRAGAYRVTVTSYQAGESGHFELGFSRRGAGANPGSVANNNAVPGCANGSCPYPQNPAAVAPQGTPNAYGQQPVYAPGQYATPGQYGWVYDQNIGQFVPVQPPQQQVQAQPQAMAPGAMMPGAMPGMAPGMIVPLPPNSVAVGDPSADGNDGSIDNNPGMDPAMPAPNGAAGTGTVYGVFVGISDYGGSNNLEYTAEDARRLSAAFQRTGLIRQGNAIVLTDGQATAQNISHAIRTVGQRVTERDTFVFFFDGHGSANEISLRSGSMNENALSSLLDGVRGRQLVVLDSCHAGSLAGIVQGHPNRTALFSSRASESSYVANELNAGGYLAAAFIEAVENGADQNGDGVVQLSELASHARSVYQRHVNGRQNLVVASGAGRAANLWRSAAGNGAVAMR